MEVPFRLVHFEDGHSALFEDPKPGTACFPAGLHKHLSLLASFFASFAHQESTAYPAGTANAAIRRSMLPNSRRFKGFVNGLFLGSVDLFFGLEPVVKLRARLVASLDVEFVGSSPDS